MSAAPQAGAALPLPDLERVLEQACGVALSPGVRRTLGDAFQRAAREAGGPVEPFLRRVRAFVENGGVWIAGPLTGTRTLEHTVPTDAGLGRRDRCRRPQHVHADEDPGHVRGHRRARLHPGRVGCTTVGTCHGDVQVRRSAVRQQRDVGLERH